MQKFTYAGVSMHVANSIARELHNWLVMLNIKDQPGDYGVPGYSIGSNDDTIVRFFFVPRTPWVFEPAFPAAPDAAGSFEASEELAGWVRVGITDYPEVESQLGRLYS
jgi:hypothetical protein